MICKICKYFSYISLWWKNRRINSDSLVIRKSFGICFMSNWIFLSYFLRNNVTAATTEIYFNHLFYLIKIEWASFDLIQYSIASLSCSNTAVLVILRNKKAIFRCLSLLNLLNISKMDSNLLSILSLSLHCCYKSTTI